MFILGKEKEMRDPRSLLSLLSLLACSRGYVLAAVPGPASCCTHAGRLTHQFAKFVVVNGAVTVGVEIFHGLCDFTVVLVGPCARGGVCM